MQPLGFLSPLQQQAQAFLPRTAAFPLEPTPPPATGVGAVPPGASLQVMGEVMGDLVDRGGAYDLARLLCLVAQVRECPLSGHVNGLGKNFPLSSSVVGACLVVSACSREVLDTLSQLLVPANLLAEG